MPDGGCRLDPASEAGADGAGAPRGMPEAVLVCAHGAGQRWAVHGAAGAGWALAGDAGPLSHRIPRIPASGEGSLGHRQVRNGGSAPHRPSPAEEKLKGKR